MFSFILPTFHKIYRSHSITCCIPSTKPNSRTPCFTDLLPSCALQTFSNVLHLYGVHTSKEAVLPESAMGGVAGAPPLGRMHVFLQHSVVLPEGQLCNDITGDSRSVLLGLADGSLHVYSWAAQVCRAQRCVRGV